jgi:hypothetical protein
MPFDSTPERQSGLLEQFLAWVEAQPPERTYNWHCGETCLLAEWWQATKQSSDVFTGSSYAIRGSSYAVAYDKLARVVGSPTVLARLVVKGIAVEPWTYGAAASRMRLLLPRVLAVADAVR